jgi:DNA-binding ferritin-like protein
VAERPNSDPKKSSPRRPPATTPEARENQLIALSVDLAEKQLRQGTASAQVLSHFLKLASSRERLEQDLIQERILLDKAKRENMASAERVEQLYGAAIDAMRAYSGQAPLPKAIDEDDDDDY